MSDRADDRDDALMTCVECGRTSPDASLYVIVNEEPARYSMDDPYPGSPGEYHCAEECLDITPSLWDASNRLADLPAGTDMGFFEV